MTSMMKINSMQMNMVDSNRLSGGIQQYMNEEDYSYNDAVAAVLKNEGWELRNVEIGFGKGATHYKEFYNKDTNHVTKAVWHRGMLVPATDDPFITNAFRVRCTSTHSWVEPNEWESPYDCRKGQRLLRKNKRREAINERKQRMSMNVM